MSSNQMLDAALYYRNKYHWSVIPSLNKKPLIPTWEPFKTRLPTEEEIKQWWTETPAANISLVCGILSGIAVVDLDVKNGIDGISRFADMHNENIVTVESQTPSGGKHLFFKCSDPNMGCPVIIPKAIDFKGNGGLVVLPPSQNGKGPYRWLRKPKDVEIAKVPSFLYSFFNSLYKESHNLNPQLTTKTTTDHIMFELGTRDNDLFHVANCLVKGRMPIAEIWQVLERLILSWGENPDPKWIQAKIESAIKRSERRETCLASDVREWVKTTPGNFLTTNVHTELQLTTREEKKNVGMILSRLCEEGIIERVGKQRGAYRLIEDTLAPIDWRSASGDEIPFEWPLSIADVFKLMPKNIVVIAGSFDAGKTAFLMNVVKMNQHNHEIHYFSSEMGPEELRSRILNFGGFDFKAHFWERSHDFHDVIKPDKINIVDFLEISDEFWKVNLSIRQIFDKLTTGACIIALQKNPGVQLGRGGTMSAEKARLYLSLDRSFDVNSDYNLARIIKAKNWRDPEFNPNMAWKEFKLVKGTELLQKTTEWRKGEKGKSTPGF